MIVRFSVMILTRYICIILTTTEWKWFFNANKFFNTHFHNISDISLRIFRRKSYSQWEFLTRKFFLFNIRSAYKINNFSKKKSQKFAFFIIVTSFNSQTNGKNGVKSCIQEILALTFTIWLSNLGINIEKNLVK